MSVSDKMQQAAHQRHLNKVKDYYYSTESVVGYRTLFRNRRHFGYHKSKWSCALTLWSALERMEQKIYDSLNLPLGSRVLEVGCAAGVTSNFMAKKGLRMVGVDLVERHIAQANQLAVKNGLEDQVTFKQGDYDDLPHLVHGQFDGGIDCLSLAHSDCPEDALAEWYDRLKSGAPLVLSTCEHLPFSEQQPKIKQALAEMNDRMAVPTLIEAELGKTRAWLEEAGFEVEVEEDITSNITPTLRLLYELAYAPYHLLKLFGLEKRLINCYAGVWLYRGRKNWRYLHILARKPLAAV